MADDDEDSSDGEQSYLSTSALSYGSFESTGTNNNYPPDNTSQGSRQQGKKSYASAAAYGTRKNPTPSTVNGDGRSSISAMSSPATIPLEFQVKFQEMEAKLKLFNEMETKMQRLEVMINKLLGISEEQENQPRRPELTSPPSPLRQDFIQPTDNRNDSSPKELFADNGDGSLFSVGFEKKYVHEFTQSQENEDTVKPGIPLPEKLSNKRKPTPIPPTMTQTDEEDDEDEDDLGMILVTRGRTNKGRGSGGGHRQNASHQGRSDGNNQQHQIDETIRKAKEAAINHKHGTTETLIGKRTMIGKRTATSPEAKQDPKRKDQRTTPVKAIPSTKTGIPLQILRPKAKKVYNPYKEDHSARLMERHNPVRANLLKTWSAGPKLQNPNGFDRSRSPSQEELPSQPMELSQPSPSSKSLPAERAKPHT